MRREIESRLAAAERIIGVSSLAGGADQIFARAVLQIGGSLEAVIPSARYEDSFDSPEDRDAYRELLAASSDTAVLPYDSPSEEAYFAAGREIVDRSDRLVAVWDGRPAAGLGGTADVVDYARAQGKLVDVVWPYGATRE